MPAPFPPVIGVLLAGGLARRLGGDKPMRMVGGKTLVERAAARLAPQCDQLIINANGDAAPFAALGFPVVPDNVGGFQGPLAGLLAAMDWTAQQRPDAEWIVSAPADAPFLPRDLIVRLQHMQADQNVPVVITESGGETHPVAGLWNVSLRADLRRALVNEDMRRVRDWIARHRSAIVSWLVTPLDPFFNINTPEELAEAERLAQFDK